MLKNLASSLILTERETDIDEGPKVKGRVVTTLHKAKEVRPLVERCVTIARKSLEHSEQAEQYATSADRGSAEWKQWRSSDNWQKWCAARAPVVAAQRRALRLLGDREAVQILFDDIAPRFSDRPGGYTRVLKLAKPRLGDAGEQAILEFVGVRDRLTTRSQKPAFSDDAAEESSEDQSDDRNEEQASDGNAETQSDETPSAEASAENAEQQAQSDEGEKKE